MLKDPEIRTQRQKKRLFAIIRAADAIDDWVRLKAQTKNRKQHDV